MPIDVVVLEGVGYLQSRRQPPETMVFDHDVHGVADLFANLVDWPDRLVKVASGDIRCSAP